MAKEVNPKIRITNGSAWSEGLEGEVFQTYGKGSLSGADYYYVDPREGDRRRFVYEYNCEIVSKDSSPNMVDHPPHYNSGKYEVIDIIEDSLRDIAGGFEAYCLGNVEKYTKRYRHKNGVEDLRKASWYLNKAIEHIEARS